MKRFAFVLVLAAVALAPPVQARRDRTLVARAEIEAANRELMARVAKGHGDEVAAVYAPDARLYAPGARPVAGRSAIAAYWDSRFDAGLAEVLIATEEVIVSGDAATEVSSYRIKGKDTSTLADGNAIAIWKKVAGRWLLWRSIWN